MLRNEGRMSGGMGWEEEGLWRVELSLVDEREGGGGGKGGRVS